MAKLKIDIEKFDNTLTIVTDSNSRVEIFKIFKEYNNLNKEDKIKVLTLLLNWSIDEIGKVKNNNIV